IPKRVKKSLCALNVRWADATNLAWERLSLPIGYIRRERPSTPSAHMALTRPVVPPDGSFLFGRSLSILCGCPRAAPPSGLTQNVLQEIPYSRGFPVIRVAGKDRTLDNGKVFHRLSMSPPD